MGRKWCQTDPNFIVDGQLFHVVVRAFTENERLATAGLSVTIPRGSTAELVDHNPNQGIADEWTGTAFYESNAGSGQVIIRFDGTPHEGDEDCAVELRTDTAHDGHRVSGGTIDAPLMQAFTPRPPGNGKEK